MLYERFKDEAQFRESFVKPLLNKLGFYGVTEQHGPQEFGKDFVFSELHRLGGMRHYAAQVKHEETIRQGPGVDALLSQIRQAFAKPFTRSDSPRECYVSAVYVFNSGQITANAKDFLLNTLTREHYGDNVHFLDGERLNALNEWGTLSSDANARARLLGLRAALRYVISDLRDYRTQGKNHPLPVFVRGIELYLSEPINSDDQLLVLLFQLWHNLQSIEVFRGFAGPPPKTTKALLPRVIDEIAHFAEEALPRAIEARQIVDTLLEKMKPL
jgi:hypothetical protein